jgi:two-component system response regulator MprA
LHGTVVPHGAAVAADPAATALQVTRPSLSAAAWADHATSDFRFPARTSTITGMAILVVDDDVPVRDALRRALTMQGYDVELAGDGEEALLRLRANPNGYDLAIVDILMPRLDGLELTRRLRTDGSQLPILMLTARDQVADRVAGLEAGADDYLVKPFALEELVARVRALLRRLGSDDEPTTLGFADLELNTGTREVSRGGEQLVLTRTEFALLELFLRNPRQVLTRSVIFDRVWGYDFGYGSNSLDVYISYLRKKTEAGGKPRLIHTVRGVGYALRDP